MDIIDSTTVVVYTAAELKSALEGTNEYTLFYLGADITMTTGINIAKRTTVVIDGLYPIDGTGTIHTLTDVASTAYTNCIYVGAASSVYVIMQNLNVYGRNYYGILVALDSSVTKDVIFEFHNITYTGPQMAYHSWGLTRFFDCNITIKLTTTSPVEELIEANTVEFGGNTIINHIGASGHATFYLRNTGASLKILPNASVTLNANMYVVMTGTPIIFSVGENAVFSVTAASSFFYSSSHYASSVTINSNAKFNLIQTVKYSSYSTFYCSGNFIVNEGAVVYMEARYSAATPLITFLTSSSQLTINNPESFILNSNAAVMSFPSTTNFSINGGVLRYWSSGTLQDQPLYTWRKTEEVNISLTGKSTANLTTLSVNNFTPEEIAILPLLSLIQLHLPRILCIVAYPGRIYLQSTPDMIAFDTSAPISTNPVLLGRSNENDHVAVYDSRIASSSWNLYAAIEGSMITSDNKHQLTEALVFVNDDNVFTLSETPTLIYSGTDNGGSIKLTNVSWDDDKGILLRLGREPLFNGEEYYTQIIWTLDEMID